MKNDRKTFKEMLNLCYEEDFPELHYELLSLEAKTKKEKDYKTSMGEILNAISAFTEDFPIETFVQIENLYQDFLENE
jgi:hypothetical protein